MPLPEPHTEDFMVLLIEALALAIPLMIVFSVIMWAVWRVMDWWWK